MMLRVAVAEISAALHQDRAIANSRSHGAAFIALRGTFIGDGDSKLREELLLPDPDGVVAAIGRVGKTHQRCATVARDDRRETVTQFLDGKPDKILARHAPLPYRAAHPDRVPRAVILSP